MVNMWAVTHNYDAWSEPTGFRPERFIEEAHDVAIMGSDLTLALYRCERRVYPGKALAFGHCIGAFACTPIAKV